MFSTLLDRPSSNRLSVVEQNSTRCCFWSSVSCRGTYQADILWTCRHLCSISQTLGDEMSKECSLSCVVRASFSIIAFVADIDVLVTALTGLLSLRKCLPLLNSSNQKLYNEILMSQMPQINYARFYSKLKRLPFKKDMINYDLKITFFKLYCC